MNSQTDRRAVEFDGEFALSSRIERLERSRHRVAHVKPVGINLDQRRHRHFAIIGELFDSELLEPWLDGRAVRLGKRFLWGGLFVIIADRFPIFRWDNGRGGEDIRFGDNLAAATSFQLRFGESQPGRHCGQSALFPRCLVQERRLGKQMATLAINQRQAVAPLGARGR